jgi:hypothetical protein
MFSLLSIVVAYDDSDRVDILVAYNNRSFTNQMRYSAGYNPSSVAVGDFKNDTHLDIVVTNYGSDNVGIFLGCGNGSFPHQTTYSTDPDSSPYSVAVGGFNNDTILDFVVANYRTNCVGVFLGYGNGKFASMILFPMEYGSHLFFVVVGDFNNDRKLDFDVANDGTDSLHILFYSFCIYIIIGQTRSNKSAHCVSRQNTNPLTYFLSIYIFDTDCLRK